MTLPQQRSSYMPALKCSNCGEEILLAFMSEHSCPTKTGNSTMRPDHPQPLPSPTKIPNPEITLLKSQRPSLPRIDINAGKPGMFLGQLTPASSYASSDQASPRSASSGQRSPWRTHPPPRNVSAPSIRRPPSPELSNLDCAFPPWPNFEKPAQDKRSRKSSTGNDYSRTHAGANNQSAASTPRSSTFGGASVRRKRTLSVTSSRQRNPSGMKTTAHSQPPSTAASRRPSLNSGPTIRRGSVEETPPLPTTSRSSPRTADYQANPSSAGQELLMTDKAAPQINLHSPLSGASIPNLDPDTGMTEAPGDSAPIVRTEDTNIFPEPPTDADLDRQPSYRAKRPPPIDSGRSMPLLQRFKSILTPRSRAPTFPPPMIESMAAVADSKERRPSNPTSVHSISHPMPVVHQQIPIVHSPEEMLSETSLKLFSFDEPKTPLEIGSGYMGEASRQQGDVRVPLDLPQHVDTPTGGEFCKDPSMLVATSDSQQRVEPLDDVSVAVQDNAAVPTENGNAVIRNARRTFHTSTDSASSYGSTVSLRSTSSRSSLPLKDDPTHTHSKTTYSAEISKFPSLNIHSPARDSTTGSIAAFQLDLPEIQETVKVPTSPQHSLDSTLNLANPEAASRPESSAYSTSDDRKPYLLDLTPLVPPRIVELQPDSPTDPLFQNGRLSPIPDSPSRHTPTTSQKSSLSGHRTALSRSETVGPNKGTCRGCQTLIMVAQKSVSSADGRLTGRFHKECFVCRTCKNPFPGADFYVLDDHPYCGQHYHELNGTICGSCGNGIEGQYMETSTVVGKPSKKFHASCLCCATCRVPLREDYFEFNGRVYCEKDAFRLASLPSRSGYDSVPSKPSPLVRELLSSSIGAGPDALLGTRRFPERRLTRLIESTV